MKHISKRTAMCAAVLGLSAVLSSCGSTPAADPDQTDIITVGVSEGGMEAQKDIEFHTAIALSSKNVVVPRLIPVINSSIPLFVETTSGDLHEETIETYREIADAIAGHAPLRAQDAMYLHLVYNRKRIQLSKTLNV